MAKKRKTQKKGVESAPESETADAPAPGQNLFPVVGIGASAGGLEALEDFFHNMPDASGMAFVVVTHIHPDRPTMLPELLGKATAMPVQQASDNNAVQPNHVYVNPPGHTLNLFKGVLHYGNSPPAHQPLVIDTFFRSLARDRREHAIAVELSGSGSDGSVGIRAIKGESGFVIVQDPDTARYTGMPNSALATGVADLVLAPTEMPGKLLAYVDGGLMAAPVGVDRGVDIPNELLQKIMLHVRTRTGHDFSAYKQSTLRRRIDRRMTVHQISDVAQYLRYLQENLHEVDLLFKEFLINVTSFFRDGEVFEYLAESVLPELLATRSNGDAFRVWVPGCASGEEAFSLAITIRECLRRLDLTRDVQIFATDLNGEAINSARAGTYPAGIAPDVPSELLERYFERDDSVFRVSKEIREMIIFASHDVLINAPFTKLDLISCRNLLIYLEAHQQQRLLPLFHYALKTGGVLVLGPSETIGALANLFEPINAKWRIFRRRDTPLAPNLVPEFPTAGIRAPAVMPPAHQAQGRTVPSALERFLLSQFAPPSVVVTENGDIVYIHGRTGLFLEPASGQPRLNVLEMARPGLHATLGVALREVAGRDDDQWVRRTVQVKTNGGQSAVDLMVRRIGDPAHLRGLFLITFNVRSEEGGASKEKSHSGGDDVDRAGELERELQYTRESLQSAIEELETSNEELTSTNEELQSTNEELQSANEELETSREEAQSLNEELTTVNAELQRKIEELSRSNDDMQNLLNATDVATVFLDPDLNIKRFTARAQELIRLIDSDIGRPLGDLTSRLDYGRLTEDCREVLRTLTRREQPVQTHDGGWWYMRILPYRTSDNVISGLVITFVEISRLRDATDYQ